jgi:hypothetical protein
MKCCYCESELVKDSFGFLCPNEKCNSIDGTTKIEILSAGTKYWYKNGELHRENGPAIEYLDGTKFWCINGLRHRKDGPAAEFVNGRKEWYKNGKLHREDGPAIERPDGTKEYWINGNKIK